jgi:hypothetical protein
LDRASFMDQLTAFLAYTNLAMPKIFHKILLCMSLSTHYPKFNISLGLGWFDDASRIVQITTQKSYLVRLLLIPLISIALFDRPTSIQQRNLARFSGRQVLELAKDNYVPLNDFSRYNPQHESEVIL